MNRDLKIPERLQSLIAQAHWPTEDIHIRGQDCKSIVPEAIVAEVFPGEQCFCFALPPFRRVSELRHEFWMSEWARPDQIDWNLSVPIGDFNIGTDFAVILDYSADRNHPSVKWLRYGFDQKNEWTIACHTFEEFADRMKLDELHFPRSPISWWRKFFGADARTLKSNELQTNV